jgi:RND family efflux transporter MFP subunit
MLVSSIKKKLPGLCLLMLFACAGQSHAETFALSGIVEPWRRVVVKAQSSGIIEKINMQEGDAVDSKKALVELENQKEAAMILLTRARVETTKSQLAENRVSLENSRKELKRKQIMKDVIPLKDLENAADVVLKYESEALSWESKVKEAQAELDIRKVELDGTYVKAPFKGVITKIYIERGETVRALDTPVCDIVSADRMYVKVAVPVNQVHVFDKIKSVEIEVEKGALNIPGKQKGKIFYINPTIDPANRTFEAKVEILEPHPLIRPGMIASVEFVY